MARKPCLSHFFHFWVIFFLFFGGGRFLYFPISGRRPETYSVAGQQGLNSWVWVYREVSPRLTPKAGVSEGVSHRVSTRPFGPRAPECPKKCREIPECPGRLCGTAGSKGQHSLGHPSFSGTLSDFGLIFKIRSYSARSDLKNKSARFSGNRRIFMVVVRTPWEVSTLIFKIRSCAVRSDLKTKQSQQTMPCL